MTYGTENAHYTLDEFADACYKAHIEIHNAVRMIDIAVPHIIKAMNCADVNGLNLHAFENRRTEVIEMRNRLSQIVGEFYDESDQMQIYLAEIEQGIDNAKLVTEYDEEQNMELLSEETLKKIGGRQL